jgi:rubrerythrin
MAKRLKDLTAREILALAIQSEEEDGRIYADLAQRIQKDYPATAQSLQAMRDEEDGHRHRLISLYRERFGEHIPLIRRQDVKGFITRKPLWLAANLPIAMIRREAEIMEDEARNFLSGHHRANERRARFHRRHLDRLCLVPSRINWQARREVPPPN